MRQFERLSDLPTAAQLRRLLNRKRYKKMFAATLWNTARSVMVAGAAAVLISALLLPVIRVTGTSMEPAVREDDVLLLVQTNQFDYGDICCFSWQNKLLIKRIIGKPGDVVRMDREGNVFVNDRLVDEPYVTDKSLGECDIKFPWKNTLALNASYLHPPIRMKGKNWVGVSIDDSTDPKVVYALFDKAMHPEDQGAVIILDRQAPRNANGQALSDPNRSDWSNQVVPPPKQRVLDLSDRALDPSGQALGSGAGMEDLSDQVPDRIRAMRSLYVYAGGSYEMKVRNFCRQGAFMADYQDDFDWKGDYFRYFPTYQDLTVNQGEVLVNELLRDREILIVCGCVAVRRTLLDDPVAVANNQTIDRVGLAVRGPGINQFAGGHLRSVDRRSRF